MSEQISDEFRNDRGLIVCGATHPKYPNIRCSRENCTPVLVHMGHSGTKVRSWTTDTRSKLDVEQSKYARLREKAQAVIDDAGHIDCEGDEFAACIQMKLLRTLREELEHGA